MSALILFFMAVVICTPSSLFAEDKSCASIIEYEAASSAFAYFEDHPLIRKFDVIEALGRKSRSYWSKFINKPSLMKREELQILLKLEEAFQQRDEDLIMTFESLPLKRRLSLATLFKMSRENPPRKELDSIDWAEEPFRLLESFSIYEAQVATHFSMSALARVQEWRRAGIPQKKLDAFMDLLILAKEEPHSETISEMRTKAKKKFPQAAKGKRKAVPLVSRAKELLDEVRESIYVGRMEVARYLDINHQLLDRFSTGRIATPDKHEARLHELSEALKKGNLDFLIENGFIGEEHQKQFQALIDDGIPLSPDFFIRGPAHLLSTMLQDQRLNILMLSYALGDKSGVFRQTWSVGQKVPANRFGDVVALYREFHQDQEACVKRIEILSAKKTVKDMAPRFSASVREAKKLLQEIHAKSFFRVEELAQILGISEGRCHDFVRKGGGMPSMDLVEKIRSLSEATTPFNPQKILKVATSLPPNRANYYRELADLWPQLKDSETSLGHAALYSLIRRLDSDYDRYFLALYLGLKNPASFFKNYSLKKLRSHEHQEKLAELAARLSRNDPKALGSEKHELTKSSMRFPQSNAAKKKRKRELRAKLKLRNSLHDILRSAYFNREELQSLLGSSTQGLSRLLRGEALVNSDTLKKRVRILHGLIQQAPWRLEELKVETRTIPFMGDSLETLHYNLCRNPAVPPVQHFSPTAYLDYFENHWLVNPDVITRHLELEEGQFDKWIENEEIPKSELPRVQASYERLHTHDYEYFYPSMSEKQIDHLEEFLWVRAHVPQEYFALKPVGFLSFLQDRGISDEFLATAFSLPNSRMILNYRKNQYFPSHLESDLFKLTQSVLDGNYEGFDEQLRVSLWSKNTEELYEELTGTKKSLREILAGLDEAQHSILKDDLDGRSIRLGRKRADGGHSLDSATVETIYHFVYYEFGDPKMPELSDYIDPNR